MTAHLQNTRDEPAAPRSRAGWLASPTFDATFIGATALVGLISAAVVIASPDLWVPILLADLWLLGYHHVISTYTRLAMDRESLKTHRNLITWLPLAVLLGVGVAGYGIGAWTLATTYFYWQWWHYTRQSWGVSRVYERKAGLAEPVEDPRLAQAAFYLFPAWGILWRSSQNPDEFLGLEIKMLPVPEWGAHLVGLIACIALVRLIGARVRAWREGRLPVGQTLYLASHYVMFGAGYLLIRDIDFGWLAINIWHNSQYILFVWYFNNQRFAGGRSDTARTLAWFSQTRRIALYMGASILLSTIVYLVVRETIALVIAPIVIYQTINFHHYIVDSLIWKVRKKPMQETLGLTPTS